VIEVSVWYMSGGRWYRTYLIRTTAAVRVDTEGWSAYWPDGHLIAHGVETGEKGQTFADLALWSQGLLAWDRVLWWRAGLDVPAVAYNTWAYDRSECRTVKLHAMLDALRRA
jgi:hypothetical protein